MHLCAAKCRPRGECRQKGVVIAPAGACRNGAKQMCIRDRFYDLSRPLLDADERALALCREQFARLEEIKEDVYKRQVPLRAHGRDAGERKGEN